MRATLKKKSVLEGSTSSSHDLTTTQHFQESRLASQQRQTQPEP